LPDDLFDNLPSDRGGSLSSRTTAGPQDRFWQFHFVEVSGFESPTSTLRIQTGLFSDLREFA